MNRQLAIVLVLVAYLAATVDCIKCIQCVNCGDLSKHPSTPKDCSGVNDKSCAKIITNPSTSQETVIRKCSEKELKDGSPDSGCISTTMCTYLCNHDGCNSGPSLTGSNTLPFWCTIAVAFVVAFAAPFR